MKILHVYHICAMIWLVKSTLRWEKCEPIQNYMRIGFNSECLCYGKRGLGNVIAGSKFDHTASIGKVTFTRNHMFEAKFMDRGNFIKV
jgi:hypothetical protein